MKIEQHLLYTYICMCACYLCIYYVYILYVYIISMCVYTHNTQLYILLFCVVPLNVQSNFLHNSTSQSPIPENLYKAWSTNNSKYLLNKRANSSEPSLTPFTEISRNLCSLHSPCIFNLLTIYSAWNLTLHEMTLLPSIYFKDMFHILHVFHT